MDQRIPGEGGGAFLRTGLRHDAPYSEATGREGSATAAQNVPASPRSADTPTVRVTSVVPAPGVDETELLRLVASLEQGSEHPLAAAVLAAGPGAEPASLRTLILGATISAVNVDPIFPRSRWTMKSAPFKSTAGCL